MSEEKTKTEEKSKIELSKKAEEILSSVENMTVIELSGLVKAMEEKFGVSAAMPMAAAMPSFGPAGAGPLAAQAEEKSTFNVVLADIGANKIQVIKVIREITSLGLKEAKDLVEAAPKPVKENVPKEEAEDIKKKIEAVGAKVELK